MSSLRLWPFLTLLPVGFALSGFACSASTQPAQKIVETPAERDKARSDLFALGIIYNNYYSATDTGPATVGDLEPYASSQAERNALAGVRRGKYMFIWNVKGIDMIQGTQNTILGYEPAVETSKGLVLFGNGHVEELTVEQFKAKPKAQPPGGQ